MSHSNGDRDYPLHICCRKMSAYKIIDKLIQIDPCVASKPDKNNKYPFHLICQNNDWSCGCSVVFEQLITCFPEASGYCCRNGDYPLHLLCRTKCCNTMVQCLIVMNPIILQKPNAQGNLPLHLVASDNLLQ
jgi:hypothetical protein